MTITIPESWLWVALWVLALWPIVGLLVWATLSQKRTAEAVLGVVSFWPIFLLVIGGETFRGYGLFMEWDWKGDTRQPEVSFHGRMIPPRWRYLGRGSYGTTAGWGSRWIQLGPLCIGQKRTSWALAEKPPVHERTKPGEGQAWEWSGNTDAWRKT